ncbi:MAG: substrate-binding domain-containing protein [Prevotella sp.]|nr:substrate-binding domain-containing protein [Prevotella sp.]
MQKNITLIAIIFITILTSCTNDSKRYKIGISQCSEDIWREKQNAELRMGAYFHDNVELRFAAAYDSDERQIQQIDSLVATDIDLLIVAPNQVATITPAIDRAFDKGIPVIVFERKTSSQKYTAFMSADNYEMGRVMGEYIATRLHGKGRVLEVMGLKGSSPAIERHNGFADALKNHPSIEFVATLQGDWTEESAVKAINDYQGNLSQIDFVFGQNDRMAMGAKKALASASTKYCGIDGLPGEDGGIRLVRDSILDATYIYPTHGDQLLEMAMNILEGKPYEKEVRLMSALVTKENANVLLMQNEEIVKQSEYLDQLHSRADSYLQRLDIQRVVMLMAMALVALLLLVAVMLYRYHLQKLRLHEERTKMEREQLDFYTQAAHELRTPLTLIEEPLNQLAETNAIQQSDDKAAELFAIVRRNTANLSKLVNKILDVQTGMSPQDLISNQTDEMVTSQGKEEQDKNTSTQATSEGDVPTLLIVDDNADIRTLLKTILQPHYQLLEAADGQEGLLVAHEQVPDLIVSDVMMPVMNGLEFCQQIKTDFVTSHIPVILLTARALNKHQIEGYESGADAYITKPFQADLLLARINNLLKSRLQLRHLWSNNKQKEEKAQESKEEVKENAFILRFKTVVEEKMADSDLSVEDIGAEMNLSRVQLYRKVKALTGCSPVDLLRKARLSEAHRLLMESDLSVSEIAYKVGFTSPSYFTKCFKEEYRKVPGEVRSSS